MDVRPQQAARTPSPTQSRTRTPRISHTTRRACSMCRTRRGGRGTSGGAWNSRTCLPHPTNSSTRCWRSVRGLTAGTSIQWAATSSGFPIRCRALGLPSQAARAISTSCTVVSGFSRTSASPPEGGHYIDLENAPANLACRQQSGREGLRNSACIRVHPRMASFSAAASTPPASPRPRGTA
jgi:hypothetical protein